MNTTAATDVKLEISCKGLRDRDLVGKSDPCAVVFLENLQYDAPQGYPTVSATSLPPQANNYPPPNDAPGAYPPYAQQPTSGYPQGGGPSAGYPPSRYGAPPTTSFTAQNAAVGNSAYPPPPPPPPHGVAPSAPPPMVGHMPPALGGYAHAPQQPGMYQAGGWPQGQPGVGHHKAPSGYGMQPGAPQGHGGYACGTWGRPGMPPGQPPPPNPYGAPGNGPHYRSVGGGGSSRNGGASVTAGAAGGYHPPASLPDEVLSWREIGRTEVIQNDLNPHFRVQVSVPYRFEEIQNIRIGIWDIDNNTQSHNLTAQDFLGDIRTTLGDLVSNGMTEKRLRATSKKNNTTMMGTKRNLGTVTAIVHENRQDNKVLVRAHITGKKLAKRDLFSSDPYLVISQLNKGGHQNSRVEVHRTEVVKKDVNPVWNPISFRISQDKSERNKDIKLELRCMDKDHGKNDEEIGTAHCTLEELMNVKKVPLLHSKKKNRKGYKHSGDLILQSASGLKMPTWIDYLQGGLRLHFNLAIDFTLSNQEPCNPASLHYTTPGSPLSNPYIAALSAVGNVLRPYTPGNIFNAYGFGAVLPGTDYVSFGFPLTLGRDARVNGIRGVIQAYQNCLQMVKFSGPTNFSHLIETAAKAARDRTNSPAQQNYEVLLIITDGAVTDRANTVDSIIKASSSSPLSIIIIGVGDANFKAMEEFDSDSVLLKSADGTRQAARDIVQFVPMNKYGPSGTYAHDGLAAAVLAELPKSIVEYYTIQTVPAILPVKRPLVPVQSFSR